MTNNKIYQEEDSTFRSNGIVYDLNYIFTHTNNEPIKNIEINKLKWQIEHMPELTKEDKLRINSVNLNIPILLTYYKNDGETKLLIVDGYHRLLKAIQKNKKTLPYKLVSDKIMKESIIRKPRLESNIDIKKSPLTQSQNDTELLSWMNKNLKYHGVVKKFLYTPEEVIEKGLAHCWESTELERRELSYLGHTCTELFLIKKDLSVTHTTLIYVKDKKYFWFEWAWGKHVGIHGPFDTKKDIIKYITDLFVKDNGIDIYGFIGSIIIKKNHTARDYFKQATKCEELTFYYLNERDQIRGATIKDTDAIKNYRDIVSKESSYINNPAKIRIRETIERYTNDSSRDYYILIQDKEIVGSITTHIDSIRGCLYIEHISVCQKAYGTGVSRKLLDFVEKNAKKHSLPVLELIVHKDNLRAIQFYKKTGFKEIQPSGQRIGVNNKIFQKQIQISKMASLENW